MRRIAHALAILFVALSAQVFNPAAAHAQRSEQDTVIVIGKGRSVLINTRAPVQRVAVGNPDVADAVVISQREVLLNTKDFGTTTLIIWTSGPQFYSVEVTPEVGGLVRDLGRFFPGDSIDAISRGKVVILSGRVRNAATAARAIELATAAGFVVVDNLSAPIARQVLLQVQIAEVSKSAISSLSASLSATNPDKFALNRSDKTISSVSEGVLDFFLLDAAAQLEATIRWLKSKGEFKTLAEPNLLALPGKEASFLAGGEFPFPVVRGGAGDQQQVTIEFKEFGVKLRFTPTITATGVIRMKIAPEVSDLDFGNGLRFGGFAVPTLLTRKAETEVELREGQFLAIAGLNNDEIRKNNSKIPILGDIPLIGSLFGGKENRQNRTELLIIVTPRLVEASNTPPALPTGDPSQWDWSSSMKKPVKKPTGAH